MTEVKILLEGYSEKGHSCSTIILIRDKGHNIVVDPGTAESQDVILDALKKERLTPDEIDIVLITHAHTDHHKNIGMFPKAKLLDYWGWWEKDVLTKADETITENISFIRTPGHSDDSITFLIKTDKGLIAICGDVFWKKNFPVKDKYANNPEKLEKSRKKLLELADYIIPGHGKMFKLN